MELTVIKDSQPIGIGSLEAQIGMKLSNGCEIIKVNAKSVIARDWEGYEEKFNPPISIYYTEAKSWGFSSLLVDESIEEHAAKERKFSWGEFAYQRYIEHGVVLPLRDSVERAGYEFAKKVQQMRLKEIQQLLEVEISEIAV